MKIGGPVIMCRWIGSKGRKSRICREAHDVEHVVPNIEMRCRRNARIESGVSDSDDLVGSVEKRAMKGMIFGNSKHGGGTIVVSMGGISIGAVLSSGASATMRAVSQPG